MGKPYPNSFKWIMQVMQGNSNPTCFTMGPIYLTHKNPSYNMSQIVWTK